MLFYGIGIVVAAVFAIAAWFDVRARRRGWQSRDSAVMSAEARDMHRDAHTWMRSASNGGNPDLSWMGRWRRR